MKIFKNSFMKTITALMLVIAMVAGMTASLGRTAKAATTITVKWDGNGGKNNLGQKTHYTYYSVSSVSLKPSSTIYTREGYKLTGFSVNGKTYSVGVSFTIKSSTTITCIWALNCSHKSYSIVSQKKPTCTEKGSVKYKCKTCGYEWTNTEKALGHNFVAPSIYGPASPFKECSRCHITEDRAAADGHVHEGPVQCYLNDSVHQIKCNKCGKFVEVSHNWATVGANGSHYTGCSEEACQGKVIKTLTANDIECRNHVNNWEYYVDNKTFSGKNMYLRVGTCPVCNSGIVEYGYVGWSGTGNEDIFTQVMEVVISAGKFALTFTGKDPGALVSMLKALSRVHSGYKLAKGVVNVGSQILTIKCDNAAMKNKLAAYADKMYLLEGLYHINPSENEYTSARNYFFSKKNMNTIYISSYKQ